MQLKYRFRNYERPEAELSQAALVVDGPPTQETQEIQVGSLGREGPLEEGRATHSSILAWRISWTEEPGGLPSMGSQRIRHN